MTSIQNNPFTTVPADTTMTRDAARFVETVVFGDMPTEVLRVGTRCLLDGLGLYVAGSDHECVSILAKVAKDTGGKGEALLLGDPGIRVPAPIAARVMGTAGHVHDWDDSQVSLDPDHVYGLLTHPTMPSLTGALVAAQMRGGVSGMDFMLAFMTGFEVETKISEWMLPQHYRRGFHSSGTVGTFGAYAAAAKVLGLKGDTLRWGFGIAASLAAGIRVNFGTMTKSLHVGRACENGITAAILAKAGYTADPSALDGIWGFCAVLGGGVSPDKIAQGFGQTWSIDRPGVSIKPYPCGVLTHPSADLMLKLVRDNGVNSGEVERIILRAGSNILNPIRYPIAKNHLQAKFSLPAILAMMVLSGKAGKREFSDAFVGSDAMQAMQQRISCQFDPTIEAKGFDKMRSSIEIVLKDGRSFRGDADERYRGGPDNPITDAELEGKVFSCAEGVLSNAATVRLIDHAWRILDLKDVSILTTLLHE
ncbi:MmgE/PrpD family protein [Brenneria roseae subsp. americana]|uniref:MmgE/PrpD family protein n=1 Tax=Brenneria roseae subsp. americana TaxID=1508507 RepID=A0A2U1TN46_9GAMM|nr:MmgE/PrpD family protein [Brenneria roseae]PWC10834.1 MmgE/PrpD family protein [Brenneria roseae subsp. americana]